jgi:hypothetical protein
MIMNYLRDLLVASYLSIYLTYHCQFIYCSCLFDLIHVATHSVSLVQITRSCS